MSNPRFNIFRLISVLEELFREEETGILKSAVEGSSVSSNYRHLSVPIAAM